MDTEIALLDYTTPHFQRDYGRVLNWIHYNVDVSDLKRELVTWAQTLGQHTQAEAVPLTRIGIEGSIAYCLNRGAMLSVTSRNRVLELLAAHAHGSTQQPDTEWEPLPQTAAGRSVLAYVNCYSRIDNVRVQASSGKVPSGDIPEQIRNIIKQFGDNKTSLVRKLLSHYQQSLREAQSDSVTRSWVKPLSAIVNVLGLMVGNSNAVKAGRRTAQARKVAATSQQRDRKGERAAGALRIKDQDDDLGLTSLDASTLVGAQAAVIFNTRNRHCQLYIAQPGQSLSVKGSRIVNYDETASSAKVIRKPEDDLAHWTRATTVRRLTVLRDDIRGKSWPLNGKINRNMLILKTL